MPTRFLIKCCLWTILLSPSAMLAATPWDELLEGPRVIQEWLLAVVPETGAAHLEGIRKDHIDPLIGLSESELATIENGPIPGDILTGDPEFDWRVVQSNGILDIDAAIQPDIDNDHSTAYLVTYVTSAARRSMVMYVGSDDSIRVWLNSKEVHRKAILRRVRLDQDRFRVTLQQGKNALMLKVSEQTGAWATVARFQNANELLFSTDKTKDGEKLPPAPQYIRNWLILPLPNPEPGLAILACQEDLIRKHDRNHTEESVAKQGVVEGERTGKWQWTLASLPGLRDNNLNEMVNNSLGWVGDHNRVTLYAFCNVYSPEYRYTDLRLGSDDSIVVWLRGEEVWRFQGLRGLQLDQDNVSVLLRKGSNLLLVKVSEESGGWGMSVRFENSEGLRYSTDRDFQPVTAIGKLPTIWAAQKKRP